MKSFYFFAGLFFSSVTLFSQAPAILWQKSLGSSLADRGLAIQQTSDMGSIVAGYTSINDGDVANYHGGIRDCWIVKLDSLGSIQWEKSLGGSSDEIFTGVQQTLDGGYIVVGLSSSNDGDLTLHYGNNTYYDYWVVKLDSLGIVQWQKTYGGTDQDYSSSVEQTNDGGYIISGYSWSTNTDISGHHGSTSAPDYWIIKLDSMGALQWEKSYGDVASDQAYYIKQTIEGGYIIAGTSSSVAGEVTGNHGGNDYWIIKTDSAGAIQWQKSYGGSASEKSATIQITNDGGYIIGGYSPSNDGDVTGNHGNYDCWIVKIDSLGVIQWQKSYGGTNAEGIVAAIEYFSIKQTVDDGYVFIGSSKSNNGDLTSNQGDFDYWIVKLDSSGVIEWQKSIGGTGVELPCSIVQTSDTGYLMVGGSASNDGDVLGHHGSASYDFWVVKLANSVSTNLNEFSDTKMISLYPNPNTGKFYFSGLEEGSFVEIFDIVGKKIFSFDNTSNLLLVDINDKSKGLYFYNISKNNIVLEKGKICIQ